MDQNNCPNCRTPVPDSSEQCPTCGKPLNNAHQPPQDRQKTTGLREVFLTVFQQTKDYLHISGACDSPDDHGHVSTDEYVQTLKKTIPHLKEAGRVFADSLVRAINEQPADKNKDLAISEIKKTLQHDDNILLAIRFTNPIGGSPLGGGTKYSAVQGYLIVTNTLLAASVWQNAQGQQVENHRQIYIPLVAIDRIVCEKHGTIGDSHRILIERGAVRYLFADISEDSAKHACDLITQKLTDMAGSKQPNAPILYRILSPDSGSHPHNFAAEEHDEPKWTIERMEVEFGSPILAQEMADRLSQILLPDERIEAWIYGTIGALFSTAIVCNVVLSDRRLILIMYEGVGGINTKRSIHTIIQFDDITDLCYEKSGPFRQVRFQVKDRTYLIRAPGHTILIFTLRLRKKLKNILLINRESLRRALLARLQNIVLKHT